MTSIEKSLLRVIHFQAMEEYPDECCGVILGHPKNKDEDIVFRCTNIQNQEHERDPENFPRDAKTAFTIDPKDLFAIEKKIRTHGWAIKTFYHSHPEHDAYFSDEDKKMALSEGGDPWYPDATHLVISVYNGEIKDQALFAWDSENNKFEAQPIESV
jgi:proteasome lid subunit RPN8/RPN11